MILAVWSSHCQAEIGVIEPIPYDQDLLCAVARGKEEEEENTEDQRKGMIIGTFAREGGVLPFSFYKREACGSL